MNDDTEFVNISYRGPILRTVPVLPQEDAGKLERLLTVVEDPDKADDSEQPSSTGSLR